MQFIVIILPSYHVVVLGSPWMNSGVTSLTAVMAKTDLGGDAYVNKYGEHKYVDLVSAYSLYIGVTSVVMATLGFGTLAQKVPGAVKTGFKVRVVLLN